jgi:hypothetical protein
MKVRMLRVLLLCLFIPVLSSCGGGGGVAEFKTVSVSAQPSTTLLESNVITGNTCSSTGSSGGTFVTDLVPVAITSTVYPNFTGTASPVEIDSCTITYTPANSLSPALPAQNVSSIGATISAGGTYTFQVPVALDVLKLSLVTNYNLQPCSVTMYSYYVTITFNALEVNTGTRQAIAATLNVDFADRAN